MDELNKRIKNQIEYYLSDENLETDIFFNDLFSKSEDGYIDLSYILNCNIIKENHITKEELIEILKTSEKIELNEERTKIRRKNKNKIPEINHDKILEKKRKRDKEKKREKQEKKHPIILIVNSNKTIDINPEKIKNVYKLLNPKLEIINFEFNKDNNEGYLAIKRKDSTSKFDFVKIFEIDDVIFEVKLCEGKELSNYWYKNSHLLSEENIDNKKIKKVKNKIKPRKLKEAIYLGEEKFDDLNEIKNKIIKITENKNLNEEEINFIKDLIKYHPDKDLREKVIKSDFIIVEKNEENKDIFYGLDKNKDKIVDFQVYKCTEKIILDDNKKKELDGLF